jgi:(p)ppGpp synthase/HD superfamily hydrolase
MRKGSNMPHFSHLLAVTGIALENGANEDEAIAALLHNAGEDAGGDLHLPVERRVGSAAVQTLIDGPFDRDRTQNRRHSGRANPYVSGLLPAVSWHVGFRANRGGEG